MYKKIVIITALIAIISILVWFRIIIIPNGMFLWHIVMIIAILFLAYLNYLAFYKDLAKKMWDKRDYTLLPLPDDYPSFAKSYKGLLLSSLIMVILLYISMTIFVMK